MQVKMQIPHLPLAKLDQPCPSHSRHHYFCNTSKKFGRKQRPLEVVFEMGNSLSGELIRLQPEHVAEGGNYRSAKHDNDE